MFERIFVFVNYSLFAFILITSMSNLGKLIGFEEMGELGISIVFGSVYMHLMIMDKKKKDKEEEKDEVD
jgi:hypothetical protein